MADSSGWITLKSMVEEIRFETGKDTGQYKKLMHHVINGLRDLNMFHFNNVKTVKVTCNDIGVIDMPSDYIKYVALSINDGGIMWTLTRRDDLVRTTTESQGAETFNSEIGEGVSIDTGSDLGYRTVGGKNDYYFTVDDRNNRFIVRGIPTRELFLQYISSGADLAEGNQTQIPIKIKQALKLWVMYQDIMMDDKSNKNLLGLYYDMYKQEVSKLKFFDLPTGDELRDVIYSTFNILRR